MANLTPEQLARLQQLLTQNGSTAMDNGMLYQGVPMFGRSGSGEDTAGVPEVMGSYIGYDPAKTGAGEPYGQYGTDGTYTGDGQFRDMSGFDPLLGMFLASALGMGAFLPGGFAAGGAGAGAGAGSGIGTMSTIPLLEVAPEALMSIPEFGAAASGAAGGAAGALSGAASGATGTMPYLPLAEMESLAPLAEFGAGSGASSLLSGLGKYLMPLAGAALGSQGVESERTESKRGDPRVDPFMFGDANQPGLLPQVSSLLSRNALNQPMRDAIMQRSQGLLAPSNGFNKYFPYGAR